MMRNAIKPFGLPEHGDAESGQLLLDLVRTIIGPSFDCWSGRPRVLVRRAMLRHKQRPHEPRHFRAGARGLTITGRRGIAEVPGNAPCEPLADRHPFAASSRAGPFPGFQGNSDHVPRKILQVDSLLFEAPREGTASYILRKVRGTWPELRAVQRGPFSGLVCRLCRVRWIVVR